MILLAESLFSIDVNLQANTACRWRIQLPELNLRGAILESRASRRAASSSYVLAKAAMRNQGHAT